MYLVNKLTSEQVLLAKYYPSTGWYVKPGAEERLNKAFDSSVCGVDSINHGGNDWEIKYGMEV